MHLRLRLSDAETLVTGRNSGGPNASMRFHVGDLFGTNRGQIPHLEIVVLILPLGCAPGAAPGGSLELLALLHHAFLIAEARERKHDVVVADPVIGFQSQSLAV